MSRAVDDILAELEADRSRLLAGDLGALSGTEARLDRALGRLQRQSPTADQIALIRQAAERNLGLVDAARAGFKAAPGPQRKAPQFQTYGPNGGARSMGSAHARHDLRR